jgi:Bacterial Ig domain
MRGRTRLILCLIGTCGVFGIAPAQAWATPSAHDVSAGTPQDVPVEVTLHGGSNLDSPVTFSIVTGPAHGSLGSIGTPNCSFNPGVTDCTAPVTYTPDPAYSGPDSFTYRVGDADGTADATASITVVPPPPPGYNGSAFTAVDPGTAATLTLPGLQGTLTNPASAAGSAFFVIATYPEDGASLPYDVRVLSADPGDKLVVTFTYPAGAGFGGLFFFDQASGTMRPVQSSANSPLVVDPVAHTVTVVLDSTSFPSVLQLSGTRFIATRKPDPPRLHRLGVHPGCVVAGSTGSASVRFSLSEAARVDVSLQRKRGSENRSSCATRGHRRRHDHARFERPRHRIRDLPAGAGRVSLPRLAAGAYRVTVTAANVNGSSSTTRRLLVLARG